jgi:DNA-binding NarL/FixJ family response regulator
MPTVALAQFEDLVAYGLCALVDGDPNLEVIADRIPPDELDAVLARTRPDVCVLNLGTLRTPARVRELAGAHSTRFIVLGNHPSGVECNQMLAFGAAGMLSKATEARDVLNAIHLASRGLSILPGNPAAHSETLTAREADVLEHLQAGRSNAEIAAALHVGTETVRTHARSVFRKLGVSNRRELRGR